MDGVVKAIARQYTKTDVPSQQCTTNMNACGADNRVWQVGSCIENNVLNPEKVSLECTGIQPTICEIDRAEIQGESEWYSQSLITQPLVQCTFKVSDFYKCVDSSGAAAPCGLGTEIDTEGSYSAIRSYIDKYGTGEFAEQNMRELYNNVFPEVCFKKTDVCRVDGSLVDEDGIPISSNMDHCSTVNSSTDLGAICFDWYKTYYSPAMERRVVNYCDKEGTDNSGFPVFPTDPDWSTVSQDCLCSLRLSNPTYVQIRQATGVVYPDACWFTPCIPDSVQLKPDITMFNPSCPTTVCQNIINVISEGGEGGFGGGVNQYINCSPTGTTAQVDAELSSERFKASVTTMYVIVLIVFFVLVIAIALATFL
jgi:hypothetical protein